MTHDYSGDSTFKLTFEIRRYGCDEAIETYITPMRRIDSTDRQLLRAKYVLDDYLRDNKIANSRDYYITIHDNSIEVMKPVVEEAYTEPVKEIVKEEERCEKSKGLTNFVRNLLKSGKRTAPIGDSDS